ncbi:Bromodomain adjacent to zinc finger domain containing hypothetical protein 1A-like [Phytophthora palmivora]|uniref:Uncharacterized protein n=1 Tax=Phytophthora palmivora TaxID=4796 RepID=A0A2P4Y0L2_9STRA|nr:Bromodomain adjacent to zinc finger domain containing hypothetical protein 1A-like [Phytophthora palmivora]
MPSVRVYAERSGYMLYLVAHAVHEFGSRQKSRLSPEMTEKTATGFRRGCFPSIAVSLIKLLANTRLRLSLTTESRYLQAPTGLSERSK